MGKTRRVAAIQATPVFLDAEKTVDKACTLIAQAGANGAGLIVFSEAFIPGYPDWTWVTPNHRSDVLNPLYAELLNNAVSLPDRHTQRLCQAAKAAGSWVVMGIHERNAEASNHSLYNTVLFIDHQGEIRGKHRKLMPTGGERLIWGQGDGSDLLALDTPAGRLGALICWENYMPLARFALYTQGVEILASPTWDKSDKWQQSMQHIAREGGLYVISCGMPLRMADLPDRLGFKHFYSGQREWINPGRSCIVDPLGNIVAGPLAEQEEILYADIDPGMIAAARRLFDVAGHYSRPDVFHFSLSKKPALTPKTDL